ncbi:MAG TPA: ECF transporter S component [bacterium]|nr:ECF transporter S component [bacterium]
MSTRRIAYSGLFIALAVALGFALIALPNLEMITATVFISGWLLGPGMGALVGALTEMIYSGMNPVGSGFLFPPLLLAQVISIGLVGMVGGLARRGEVFFLATGGGYLAMGVLGALLTVIFDLLTTISFPLTAGFSGVQMWSTVLAGLGLSGVHVVSNSLIFAILVPQILRTIHKQLGITEIIR